MFKNVASTFIVFCFDATTNVPKTGDAANLTAYVKIDAGAVTVLGDISATELDATNAPGYYVFDAAQAETNGDRLLISGKSSTSNVKVIGAPAVIYTRPTTGWLAPATAGRTLVVDAAGLADANVVKVGPTGSGTAQTAGDLKATLGTPAGASLAADLAEIEAETDGIAAISTATPLTAAQIATGVWQDSTAGDFTVGGTIGKSIMQGVALGTGINVNVDTIKTNPVVNAGTFTFPTNATGASTTNITAGTITTVGTLTTYTGNTPQTADVATLITTVGAAGAGLTAVGLATTSRAGIRKNTALAKFEFLMTDSTNHNPSTGLAVTVTRSIDGGAFAAGTLSAVTEIGVGIYSVDFGAGDLNGTMVTLRCTAAASDDLFLTIHTDP